MKIREFVVNILKRFYIKDDVIYNLCKRYINIYNSGDSYWLTDTEIQLYTELEKRLKI